ncbi:hypothetical protein RB195_002213 [Necator americanus]|uniref:poly(ADP-ribose) glycohydrolase n=1 Tax=Necator americanus TaxID=51031 RepID=A0ABR1DHZ4_NECAM
MEIEESPEEDKKTSRRKGASKQINLAPFLTPSTSESQWKPIRKNPPSKKKVTVVRKKIAIDPKDSQRKGKVSVVVNEVPSGDEDKPDIQQERLRNSIKRATRKSIKHYFKKDSPSKVLKKSVDQSPEKTPTLEGNNNNFMSSSQQEPPPEHQLDIENASARMPEEDQENSKADDIVEVDSSSTPEGDRMKELEVVLEVHNASTPRRRKRANTTTPRAVQRCRFSADTEMNMEHRLKGHYSTPRRKLFHHRSFSVSPFTVTDEDFEFPPVTVVRRRRPNSGPSVFDLGLSGRGLREFSSTSAAACVRKINLTEAALLVPNEDEDSDRSLELDDSIIVASMSTPVLVVDDGIRAKEHVGSSNSGEAALHHMDVVTPSEGSSIQLASRFPGSTGNGACLSTSDEDDDDIVVLETVQRTPSKSQPLTELLYSPRKMELTNGKRLDAILAKAAKHYKDEPDLHYLASDTDYCAFQVSTLSQDSPPEPSPTSCADMDLNFGTPGFVRLPWSTANISNGFHQCVVSKQRYVIIERALRALVQDGANSIEAVIVTLKECAPWIKSFDGLIGFIDGLTQSEEREALDILAGIAKLAVNAKFIITAPLPLLTANHSGSVTLSQEQCACLLAHAFYCTFRRERHNYNRINFANIFHGANPLSHVKLRFILNYFSSVLKKMPTGCVSFRREVISQDEIPNWEECEIPMPLVAVASDGSIEDSHGCLQVDFANEYIGGGVLNSGAVQEEIRFLICPEMIVSCLLCEKMGPFEAIHIVGAQRYSDYFGYGETLEWNQLEDYGSEPRDEFLRVISEVVAMDAKLYKPIARPVQYRSENIDRELNKAYAGFLSRQKEARPIATGNWGCGVFGGDKELKSLIQMMAAAKVGRDMIYYTFTNEAFEHSMNDQYEKLLQKKATVGTLYKALISYRKERERNPRLSVFEHVYAYVSESACTTS